VPRYDTLLEAGPRPRPPTSSWCPRSCARGAVLVRDHLKDQPGEGEERPLYVADGDEDTAAELRDEVWIRKQSTRSPCAYTKGT